ncbi:MAG: hypothetical protein RLZZ175_2312 [Bacteroidota bacterium]|jgi:Ca-activated chloride channel family protein
MINRITKIFLGISIILLGMSNFAHAQFDKKKEEPKLTRILFIFDCSGSMLANWENDSRMNNAKKVFSELVDSLKNKKNLEIALRCYGHQYDKVFQNCKDTKLEVPFLLGPKCFDMVKAKVKTLVPRGNTPIAYSLEQGANDFPNDPNVRNVIILITDGLESCNGDPCALSLALQKNKIFLKPFIIGLGVDDDWGKAFECMGQFFEAKTVGQYKSILSQILGQTLNKTTVSVKLLDLYDKPTETNVDVTFVNNVTNEPVYDFIHYLDAAGNPDTLNIDAVISYDVIVNTTPPRIKRNVYLEGGKHNVIEIKCPQGTLNVNFEGGANDYKNLNAIVSPTDSVNTLHNIKVGVKDKFIVGTYDVEVLTLPRIVFKEVSINQSQTTNLKIPQPGVLSIPLATPGWGSLYQVLPGGEHKWIYNFDNNSKIQTAIQPGDYKIVFRAKGSKGAQYTDVQYFKIQPGVTTMVKLFNK